MFPVLLAALGCSSWFSNNDENADPNQPATAEAPQAEDAALELSRLVDGCRSSSGETIENCHHGLHLDPKSYDTKEQTIQLSQPATIGGVEVAAGTTIWIGKPNLTAKISNSLPSGYYPDDHADKPHKREVYVSWENPREVTIPGRGTFENVLGFNVIRIDLEDGDYKDKIMGVMLLNHTTHGIEFPGVYRMGFVNPDPYHNNFLPEDDSYDYPQNTYNMDRLFIHGYYEERHLTFGDITVTPHGTDPFLVTPEKIEHHRAIVELRLGEEELKLWDVKATYNPATKIFTADDSQNQLRDNEIERIFSLEKNLRTQTTTVVKEIRDYNERDDEYKLIKVAKTY